MAGPKKTTSSHSNFDSISQNDLPSGRKGKHYGLLMKVLEDLKQLPARRAIRIPLGEFPGSVAVIRSAISRATRKRNIDVTTSSDEEFFYVYRSNGDGH